MKIQCFEQHLHFKMWHLGIYEKPHNLLPHLAILALSIGPGGASLTSFPYFVISALHLICAGIYEKLGPFDAKDAFCVRATGPYKD
jgi:hypothetical protein